MIKNSICYAAQVKGKKCLAIIKQGYGYPFIFCCFSFRRCRDRRYAHSVFIIISCCWPRIVAVVLLHCVAAESSLHAQLILVAVQRIMGENLSTTRAPSAPKCCRCSTRYRAIFLPLRCHSNEMRAKSSWNSHFSTIKLSRCACVCVCAGMLISEESTSK